jgi:hypothetical protein
MDNVGDMSHIIGVGRAASEDGDQKQENGQGGLRCMSFP